MCGLPLLTVIAGFCARIVPGYQTFLNPDEALHLFLSDQPGLRQAYEASLKTAHPPLIILFMSVWQKFGSSELFLRLPFIVAGTAFGWIMFLWIRDIADRSSGLFALALFTFSPSLISLSAEIRQYSFLLLFCSASLYLFDSGLVRDSVFRVAGAAIALYLALLTHYSSLIFALGAGFYQLIRLKPWRSSNLITGIWAIGQIGALGICYGLYRSHIRPLQESGLPTDIAETWLRTSVYHRGEDQVLHFIVHQTTRFFRFAISHGTIGTGALIFFLVGITALFLNKKNGSTLPEELRWLLLLPFGVTITAALAGIYPYGGTRHDAILVLFGLTGTALGLVQLPKSWTRYVAVAVALGLIICNLFPFPTPPYILRPNQRKELMTTAVGFMRQRVAPDEVLFSDFEGGLLLSRYWCDAWTVPRDAHSKKLFTSACDGRELIVTTQAAWHLDISNFDSAWKRIAEVRREEREGHIWLFQAGWIDDKESAWINALQRYGCREPHNFGPNVFVCRLEASQTRK